MENKFRHLDARGKGELDYDLKQDILFFKVKDREYVKSIELDNIVIDIDSEQFITGIQIFEASKFLRIDKAFLTKMPTWEFNATIKDNKVELRLTFTVVARNKIIEKISPIIIEKVEDSLPNSEMLLSVAK